MEQHDFIAGPNGLCEKCGKTRKNCIYSNEVYVTGIPEASGIQVNKAIVFFEQIPENCKVHQIVCSKFNTFILSTTGQVFSWGETTNALGRVLEKREDSRIPRIIFELKSQSVVSIACGESHVLALADNKTIWSWGFNKFGQLGQGDFTDRTLPTQISSIKNIVKIAAAANFSYAISENGRVYAWGDNKNFQLGQMVDENGNKQNKFSLPINIENLPWDKTPDLELAGGNGNNYFYKNKVQANKAAGVSSYEAKMLQLENQELRRKLEYLSKKVLILEEELYKNSSEQNPKFGVMQDTALQEMRKMVKENERKREEIDRKMKDLDEEILKHVGQVKDIEGIIADLDQKESGYWDEIEGRDNDLIKLQNKKVADLQQISEVKRKKTVVLEYIKTIENTKATYYSDMHFKQDLLEQVTTAKTGLEIELAELNKNEIVFKQMIVSREKELERNYVMKKQPDVDSDLIQLTKIHNALQETSLESIAKSITTPNIMSFIETSNNLLERLQEEITNFKAKAKKSPLKALLPLWSIIDDNINLRKNINVYTEALLFNSASQISSKLSEPSSTPSSNLVTPLAYAKRIFAATQIPFPVTHEVLFHSKSKSPIRKKLVTRHKWRLC